MFGWVERRREKQEENLLLVQQDKSHRWRWGHWWASVTLQSEEVSPLGPNTHLKVTLFSPLSKLSCSTHLVHSNQPASRGPGWTSPCSHSGSCLLPIWGLMLLLCKARFSSLAGAGSHPMTCSRSGTDPKARNWGPRAQMDKVSKRQSQGMSSEHRGPTSPRGWHLVLLAWLLPTGMWAHWCQNV